MMPAARKTSSNAAVRLASPSCRTNFTPRPGILQIHEQVPGLLDRPRLDRVLGGSKNGYPACAVLYDGQVVRVFGTRNMTGDHHGRTLGQQLYWSAPWTGFSARKVPLAVQGGERHELKRENNLLLQDHMDLTAPENNAKMGSKAI